MAKSKSKTRNKAKNGRTNRSLNAFAIATATDEKPTRHEAALEDERSMDGGSDSEGGEWKIGVGSKDDSDIDSDEAMGESDEERFEGFAFRGSKSGKTQEYNDDDEEDEDKNGEGYIDISEMLDRGTLEDGDIDAMEEEGEPRGKIRRSAPETDDEDGRLLLEDNDIEEDEGSESEGEDNGFTDSEDEGGQDPLKLQALESLISSLPTSDRPAKRARLDDPNEFKAPGEYNLSLPAGSQKLTVADLLPSVTDPKLKKSLKLLADDGTTEKPNGVPGKLLSPLAKRQQDRIDRSVAYEKTKDTLKRWVDTVKHNREADHLSFPLANDPGAPIVASKKLIPINPSESKPMNDFESTITGILKESGIASEKQIQEFEALKTNELTIEDVQKRTAQLRMARELMYREEVKAKRLKKIKSKAYHRIKKRERQRQEKAVEEAEAEERGGELDPTEEEERARGRAEERMSLKHKQSRWARGMKDSGRGAWDLDARNAAVEMAQRHEDLRRRIQGKEVGSDEDSDESSDSGKFDEEGEGERKRMLIELEKAETDEGHQGGNMSKLMNMKFMQNAEAAKRKENEEMIKSLRQEWGDAERVRGSEEDSEYSADELEKTGRTIFKPGKKETDKPPPSKPKNRNEFEAPPESEEDKEQSEAEGGAEDEVRIVNNATALSPKNPFIVPKVPIQSPGEVHKPFGKPSESSAPANPWLPQDPSANIARPKAKAVSLGKQDSKGAKANHKISKARKLANNDGTADVDMNVVINPNVTLTLARKEDSDGDERQINLIPAKGNKTSDQRELIKKAFAGDKIVREFSKEKQRIMEEEDDQVIDETLPGWGHWSGAGLSSRQRKFNAKRKKDTRTVEGIKKDKRKDAKLERVIINEKVDKKAIKFHAKQLPHPFESKAQYERSLRLPIGPEWTTKATFQDATMPTVTVKQGRVVEPMAAPFK